MNKTEIAEVLKEIGVLLELKGQNPFKVRAYQSGSRALENLEEDLGQVLAEERLDKVSGIGKALAEKIETLYQTGELPFYQELKDSIPPGLIEMLEIPGLGPKKVKALHGKLGIETIDELTEACQNNQIAALEGFGAKSQEKILSGIKNREAYAKRHLWWEAFIIAESILEHLRGLSGVERAEYAGSLRRGLETVGDIDFIVASSTPSPIMDWFTGMDEAVEVTAHGETKSSVRLAGGLQADIRVVPVDRFPFALHHFTGSKDHNVRMRQRAISGGYSLSEWGLVREEGGGRKRFPPGGHGVKAAPGSPEDIRDEAGLFSFLGLHYIPPELREGLDEIEAAEKDGIPRLVEAGDIRGVFHNHTTASDGRHTLEEMVRAAQDRGWEYLGIADHSKSSFQANGLTEARLEKQVARIRELNLSEAFSVHVFSGVECDILPDGRLDFDDEVLATLDYVVASVHSSFTQGEKEMTRRLIRAIEHPSVTMLGHLTGRLLLAREGYAVNPAKIIDAAAANGVILEINAHPRRLDMDWRHWKRAAAKGVLASVNPDAHDVKGFEYVRAGVTVARKGWLTRASVFNTRSLEQVREYLEGRKRGIRIV